MVTFMNGVEVCPVSCLSNFSLVSTLLDKSIASLRLFTLMEIKSHKVGMEGCFLKFSNIYISSSLALLLPDSFLGHRSLLCLYFHQI